MRYLTSYYSILSRIEQQHALLHIERSKRTAQFSREFRSEKAVLDAWTASLITFSLLRATALLTSHHRIIYYAINTRIMSVLCRFYVSSMSVLCQFSVYSKLHNKLIINSLLYVLCQMTVVFAISITSFSFHFALNLNFCCFSAYFYWFSRECCIFALSL